MKDHGPLSRPSSKRRDYLQQIWSQNPFPQANARGTSLRQPFSEKTAVTRGRLVEFSRNHLVISSEGEVRKFPVAHDVSLAPDFHWFDCVVLGDILEVVTGGLAIEQVRILVPCQRSYEPFKTMLSPRRARQWQEFMAALRNFFEKRDFIELRTPTLVPSPGLEPHLDPFHTEYRRGRVSRRFFLPTSPEFHLKKALTLGFEKCFEFKECFRNGELSDHHQPEFLMLEWYRAYEDTQALIKDVTELLAVLDPATGQPNHTSVVLMEDLWRENLDFNLTPKTDAEDLRTLAQNIGVEFEHEENFDDLFARIFLEKLEPVLAKRSEPVILYHFPPSQAALSRLTGDGWADRFELYWRGLEIANAFHELNDPGEQRRRFREDQEKKRQLEKEVVPVDEEFLTALEWGMPPSAGIALGVERLFMALHGLKTLDEVRLFPMKLEV